MNVSNVVMSLERVNSILAGNCSTLMIPAMTPVDGKTPEELFAMPKDERQKLSPRGSKGDIIWVQEPWISRAPDDGEWRFSVYSKLPPPGNIEAVPARYQFPDYCIYQATFNDRQPLGMEIRWAPAATMPRWASRLYLGIQEVDMVHLNDITPQIAASAGNAPNGDKTSLDVFKDALVSVMGSAILEKNPLFWQVRFARMDLHFVARQLEGFPRGVPAVPKRRA